MNVPLLTGLLLAGVITLTGGCDIKSTASTKGEAMKGIAVVNVQRIFKDSAPAAQGREHLEQVKVSLNEGADAINAVYGEKGSHPSQGALQQGWQRLNLQYQAEEQSVNKSVADVLATTARDWLKEHPDTVVLPSTSVLAYGPQADMTSEMIARMENVKPTFGDVPRVTVTAPEEPAAKGSAGGDKAPGAAKKGDRPVKAAKSKGA